MSTQTRPTRKEFREIKQSLIKAGWTEEFTIMSAEQSGSRFGTLYTKNNEEFWLNYKTINNLPI